MTSTWVRGLQPNSERLVPELISPPNLVEQAEREIGVRATQWAAQTAQRIVDEVTARFREAESPAMVTGSEREGCEASLLTVLVGLHKQIPSVSRSGSATESVHQSVHRGVAINTVLKTVWACHAMAQDALLAEVEKVVPGDRLVNEVRQLNRAMNSYITSYAGELLQEYEEEVALWKGRVPAEQLRVFTQLVAGVDPGENAEEILGVRLTDAHLVASVWSRAVGHVNDKDGAVADFAYAAGDALGASTTLVLPQEDVTEVWWSWKSSPPAGHVDRLRQLVRPVWMNVALGVPGRGTRGVLSSHAACLQAVRVGRWSEVGSFWPYEQVRVVALLCADPDGARSFTRAELTGLTAEDRKTATLRETLRVWLASGGSRTVTAERLFIAVNTVSYRVAKAGDLLGRPAGQRQVETVLALDLAYYFPDFLA